MINDDIYFSLFLMCYGNGLLYIIMRSLQSKTQGVCDQS